MLFSGKAPVERVGTFLSTKYVREQLCTGGQVKSTSHRTYPLDSSSGRNIELVFPTAIQTKPDSETLPSGGQIVDISSRRQFRSRFGDDTDAMAGLGKDLSADEYIGPR